MAYATAAETILNAVLTRGYQVHPEALKILEARGEATALAILDSFTERFPDAVVIEADHLNELLAHGADRQMPETPESGSRIRGRITQIYDGSGLIQRCPKCNRWIIDNFCMVHSDVEGVWDLRIKARLETAKERCTLIFKREATEKCAKLTLAEAKLLGEAATLARIRTALYGKQVEVLGVLLNGGNFLVKDIRER
ncbi:MAG TPA: hypothetical protein ENN68_06740 [Methanomicrobia archaeon]|nr:hypothetical protein [Methanomicrobia archaeon]